jgi:septal ring factor EnvC (AmiA/AmiB activator)
MVPDHSPQQTAPQGWQRVRARWCSSGVLLAALLLAGSALPGAVSAQSAGEITARRSDLDDLKRRIRELQRDMAQTAASRSTLVTALSEAEREVSRLERRLRLIASELARAEQQLKQLEVEQQGLEVRIAARQGELADWLRRHYMQGAAEGVAPLLSAQDPNQIARDARYLEYLGRARLALIEGLRVDLQDKNARATEIAARRQRLRVLEAEQRRERNALESVHEQRRQALATISQQLQAQREAVGELRQDEQRLAQVVDMLAQRARALAARRAAEERAAAQRAAERRAAEKLASEQRAAERRAADMRAAAQRAAAAGYLKAPEVAAVTEAPVVVAAAPAPAPVRAAEPTPTGVRFGQLRGQLRVPVRGELGGRFGAQRARGGPTWKGIFIRAANGSEVRAVAAGEVVFSDWLRGYGNLLIIDHGDDYLSVYGNNDALLKEVGDAVRGGEVVASVGVGGSAAESGLYLEIRHQGRPLDPSQWVRLNQ